MVMLRLYMTPLPLHSAMLRSRSAFVTKSSLCKLPDAEAAVARSLISTIAGLPIRPKVSTENGVKS